MVSRGAAAVLRQTSVFLAGQGLRLGLQTSYLLLFAAALGPADYGRFTIAAAAAALLGTLAGFGLGHAMVRRGTDDPAALPTALGRAEGAILATGVLLAAILAVVLPRLFPDAGLSAAVVAAVALGDLVCLRLSEVQWLGFQARLEDRWAVTVQNLVALLKLAAAGLLIAGWAPLPWWPWLYAGAGLLAVAIGRPLLARRLGGAWRPRWPGFAAWREGSGFAAGAASQTAQAEIDKILVGRLCGPEVAGLFGLALKVVDAAHVPLRSFQHAAYARVFSLGQRDPRAAWDYVRGVARLAVPVGLAVAGGLLLAGPLLPALLGPRWQGVGPMVAALAFLPLLRGLATLGLDGLWGIGRLRRRALLPLAGLAVSLGAAAAFAPASAYRWPVAAAAATAAIALVAVLAMAALRRGAQAAGGPSAATRS